MSTEQYIDCCEWCGKDTALWGRFMLKDGPGLKVVLCGICASATEYEVRCDAESCAELVADAEVIRR